MKLLENVPVVPPSAKIFMFGESNVDTLHFPSSSNFKAYLLVIGLSQASTRMHRQGQIPILKFGVPIVASFKTEETTTAEDTLKPPTVPKSSGGFPLNEGIAPRRPLPNDHPATQSPEAIQRIKSAEKARAEAPEQRVVTSSNPTTVNNLEKIAESVERSVTRLWVNSGGVLQRLPARIQQ